MGPNKTTAKNLVHHIPSTGHQQLSRMMMPITVMLELQLQQKANVNCISELNP
jgi:hypothetical protein